jgi:hypothetical protein
MKQMYDSQVLCWRTYIFSMGTPLSTNSCANKWTLLSFFKHLIFTILRCVQANDLPSGLVLSSIAFLQLWSFLQNNKHGNGTCAQICISKHKKTKLPWAVYTWYLGTHTSLSSRKSLSRLGECCRNEINESKSAVIHHSPRDNVFRLRKTGHVFSSLFRIAFIWNMLVNLFNA